MAQKSFALNQERLNSVEGIQLNDRTYNLAIGGTLLIGILLNIAIASFFTQAIASIPPLLVLLVYIGGTFGFSMMIYRSKNPVVSFLGFLGLAAVMGIMLTNILTFYSIASVQRAFTLTGIIFILCITVSTIFPNVFLRIGRSLGIMLLITIIVEAVVGLIFRNWLGFFDYVVVLIFCGFTAYDWARAQAYPKTLDNAIDSAADLYMDVINLFVRILSITSSNNDN